MAGVLGAYTRVYSVDAGLNDTLEGARYRSWLDASEEDGFLLKGRSCHQDTECEGTTTRALLSRFSLFSISL
jgi:hypothetical protein